MGEIAAACWDAVDNVSDEPAILAGCSVGFTVALHMAAQQPARTSAILLSGCSYRPGGKPFTLKRIETYAREGVAFREMHFYNGVSKAFAATPLGPYFERLFVERNDTADASSIIEMFRALGAPDPEEIFEPKAPVLIITGSEDSSHESAFGLRDRMGCELVTIEGAGHCCQLEQPWEWDRFALEFLRRAGVLEAS
jgi:pimeloyl-ACP methyl ester carboxylesterase